jgi:HEAT repeat protein
MSTADPKPALSPDDALPPVTPPSAGFIVQLFVVPGIIVTIIVLVYLSIGWLAQMGGGAEGYVRALERNSDARWQAAYNLAVALHEDPQVEQQSPRRNKQLAGKVADMLTREIDEGSTAKGPIALRFYLCQALGEFQVPEGLPVLVRAAGTQRQAEEADVRRSALKAIGTLSANLRKLQPPQETAHPDLEKTVLAAARDSNPEVRGAAAVALGMVGAPGFTDKLRTMLADSHPNVRYNAAIHLARHGDTACLEVLIEMLDPQATAGVDLEPNERARAVKRNLLYLHGLEASRALAEKSRAGKSAGDELAPLVAQLEKLVEAPLDREVRTHALDTLRRLRQDSVQAEASAS